MLFQLLIYMNTDGFGILENRKQLFCLVIIIILWFENHLLDAQKYPLKEDAYH